MQPVPASNGGTCPWFRRTPLPKIGLMQTTLETSNDLLAEHRAPWVTGPVVVGFDGSDSALRGLERIAGAMADSARLIVVVVEPQVHSRGLLSAPLLQSRATPG
jgi:hypothetical protein